MTNYTLAKLILLAGGIESRKRVQKTVHLLQAAGCPLDVQDFRIHHYGPYSKSLAKLLDEMSSNDLLIETKSVCEFGPQYDYQVNPEVKQSLLDFEETEKGSACKKEIEEYSEKLKTLCETPSRVLELASTIVGFHGESNDWESAVTETASFKRESDGSNLMNKAKELAATMTGQSDGKL